MDTVNSQTSTRPTRRTRRLAVMAVAAAVALGAAACGDSDDAAGAAGDPTVDIVAPAAGTEVGPSFDVQLAVNFPIGEPDTGRDHVHLYYDGNRAEGEYGIAYEETFTVSGLAPGEHSIQAVVAHADHSTTEFESQEITVDVADGESGTATTVVPTPSSSSAADLGY